MNSSAVVRVSLGFRDMCSISTFLRLRFFERPLHCLLLHRNCLHNSICQLTMKMFCKFEEGVNLTRTFFSFGTFSLLNAEATLGMACGFGSVGRGATLSFFCLNLSGTECDCKDTTDGLRSAVLVEFLLSRLPQRFQWRQPRGGTTVLPHHLLPVDAPSCNRNNYNNIHMEISCIYEDTL